MAERIAESDIAAAERIASGEMHPALVEAFALLARVRAEHDELASENAWLKRRLAEEDARISRE